jgi:hypothetical protein
MTSTSATLLHPRYEISRNGVRGSKELNRVNLDSHPGSSNYLLFLISVVDMFKPVYTSLDQNGSQ